MKAAVLIEQRAPLQIMELKPRELDVGQVLVKVEAAGICGAQVNEISGACGHDPYLPHMLGHEGCGTVLMIGPGVKTVEPGSRVVMHWRKGAGIEAVPAKYETVNKLVVGSGPVATFATSAVVSENRLTKIRNDIPFEIGALMGCAVTTGLGLINNEAKLKIGQSIAVAGVGGVGLNIIQGAVLAGAGHIVAIDIHDEKLDRASAFGADQTIMNEGSFTGKVPAVDVFVDCTGISDVVNKGLQLVKPGGKMILVGQPQVGTDTVIENARQHYCGKTIIDSQGGLTNPAEDIPRYLELYRKQRINLHGLITHRFALDEINEAISTVVNIPSAGRVIVEM